MATETEKSLKEARQKLAAAEAIASDAWSRVGAYKKLVAGLEAVLAIEQGRDVDDPSPVVVTTGGSRRLKDVPLGINGRDAPRGREAVLRVIQEAGPTRGWQPRELIAEVRRRGWIDPKAKNPDAAIRIATRRLVDVDHVLVKVNGEYRLASGSAVGSADGQQQLGKEDNA